MKIKVNAVDTIRARGDSIYVNDDLITVDVTHGYKGPGGHRIERRGNYYYLEYGTLNIKWDNEGTWFITLSEPHGTHNVRGLCGDYNKNPHGMLCTLILQ